MPATIILNGDAASARRGRAYRRALYGDDVAPVRCPSSGLMKQIALVEEGRISA